MLTVFRENARGWISRVIIWFVAITFVGAAFLVYGRGSETAGAGVAKVGETIISKRSFDERRRQVEDMFRKQFQGNVGEDFLKTLNAPAVALNSLIEAALQGRSSVHREYCSRASCTSFRHEYDDVR